MLERPKVVNDQPSFHKEEQPLSDLKRAAAPFIALDAASAVNVENALAVERIRQGFRVSLAVLDPFSLPDDLRVFSGVVESRQVWEQCRHVLYSGNKEVKQPRGFVEGRPTRALVISVDLVGPELSCEGCRVSIDDAVVVTRRQFRDLPRAAPTEGELSEVDAGLYATARLALNLFCIRRERGDVVFADVSRGLLLQPDGSWELFPTEDLLGRIANQEITCKVSEALAKLAVKHNIPLLYRGCDVADRELTQRISSRLKKGSPLDRSDIDELLIDARGHRARLLRRSVCSTTPIPHEGLGLQAYLRLSAPLRVFQDFVNLSQIMAWTSGQLPPYSAERLSQFAEQVNVRSPERVKKKGEQKYLPLIEEDLKALGKGALLPVGMLRSLVADCRDAGVMPAELIRYLTESLVSRSEVAAPLLADLYFSSEMRTSPAVRESARWMVKSRPDLVDLMVRTAIESVSLRRHSSTETMVEAGRLFESIWIVDGRVVTTQRCIHRLQHASEAVELSRVHRLQFTKLCGLQPRGETEQISHSALFPQIRRLQWELKKRDNRCDLLADFRGSDGRWDTSLKVVPPGKREAQDYLQTSGVGDSWLQALEGAAQRACSLIATDVARDK